MLTSLHVTIQFVAHDSDEEADPDGAYGTSGRRSNARSKSASRVQALAKSRRSEIRTKNARYGRNGQQQRRGGRGPRSGSVDEDFEMAEDDEESNEESLELPEDDEDEDDGQEQQQQPKKGRHQEEDSQALDESPGRPRQLRARKEVNYALPAPPGAGDPSGRGKAAGPWGAANGNPSLGGPRVKRHGYGGGRKTGWDALPASMSGKDLAKLFGDDPDSSDDDIPRRPTAAGAAMAGPLSTGMLASGPANPTGSGIRGDLTGTGATDTMGKLKAGGDPMADIDPLGVDMQIDFDAVGGLDGHIEKLKEMVTLPLLYPELFQQFKITPPRGVLFHGPPGTGKTLVARALAASCSSEGQKISFFMRKGADVLSKWVGEAERQLRLLFEEARNCQPSIIFFDEIDGLAPVRSSKQDQIHASIVSTMLALMDGMDGRGQVVVIGATNRPDSVDPALRRPGRFDREFYFPLPSKEARRKILDIHTKMWEPPMEPAFKDKVAELTKGYGGADLRVSIDSSFVPRAPLTSALSWSGALHGSGAQCHSEALSADLPNNGPSAVEARERTRGGEGLYAVHQQ